MKTGDVFEFIDYKRERSQPQHEFYDETLERWIPVNDNTFVCLAHVKNPDWDGRYDHSLYFTDGFRLFHTRVNETPVRRGPAAIGVALGARVWM